MTILHAARPVAAIVLTAAGLVLPAGPASAATCSSADGVTVVVDFHELGGGVQTVCDAGGGGQAASRLFPDNGFPLEYVQRQPGFVCRVSGAPTADDEPCVNTPPTDAYWGLWWTDGESGSWSYSSEGVASLTVPEGGSVALSWNGSTTKSPPGVAAPVHDEEPSATPTPQPSGGPGGSGSGGGGAGAGGSGGATTAPSAPSSGSPTGTPSGAATTDHEQGDGTGPGRRDRDQGDHNREGQKGSGKKDRDRDRDETDAGSSADALSTAAPVVTADPPDASDDGLPVWVAPAGIAGLFGIAGVVALLRRRSMA